MAPSVSTGDGGRNVAGEYLVADRLITSISPRRLTGVYGLVLQPDPEKTCCLGAGNRRGTSIETEGQRLRAGSGEGAAGDVAGEACHRSRQRDFHRLDGVARRGADKARYFD